MRLRLAAISPLLSLVLAGPASAQEPRQILAESLAPRDTTYAGDQVSEAKGGPGERQRVQRQRVQRAGSTLRIDWDSGQVLYDNGREQVMFFPRRRMAEKDRSAFDPRRIAQQQRAILAGRPPVTQLQDERVAGRPAYVLMVQPPKGPSRKVWVDRETYVQLRQDVTQPNGRTVSTYFTRIDFDAAVSPERLVFTPPLGTEVVQRGERRPIPRARAAQLAEQWGGLQEPSALPAGYRLRGYYRHNYQGRPALVSVYDGPGGAISLFQGPAVGMRPARRQDRNLRVLTRRKGSADVILVGPQPAPELQRVMDSVN